MINVDETTPADTVTNVYTNAKYTYHGRCKVEAQLHISFEGIMLQHQRTHEFLVIPLDVFEMRFKN